MARIHPSDRLTSEDAAFLYLETQTMPLHIGSVSTLDGEIPFEEWVNFIERKLALIPRYRQRLLVPPLHVGHPTWEADPNFDIGNHVHSITLKRGDEAELQKVASGIFSEIMDRNKPLWDVHIVYGLKNGRSGLITRVHHCMVDGVAGVGLLNILLDVTPQASPLPKRQAYHAPPLPSPERSLADALLSAYSEGLTRMFSAQSAALNIAEALAGDQAIRGWDRLSRMIPELLSPVERLPFNSQCAGPRRLVWTEFAIPQIRAIREKCGGTLNDVALTMVTSATRRYSELHGTTVKNRLLRFMVPVNIRKQDEHGLGNRVSLLPVNVPLDIRDPVQLLNAVRERTEALKSAHVADFISLVATWIGTTPAPLQAMIGRGLASILPVPSFNLVCTNVPGPQFPIYALGHEMLTYYPYLPISNEMGLGVAIQGYNGKIYVGITGDIQAMPDVARFKRMLDQAFGELFRRAVGQSGRRTSPLPKPVSHSRRRTVRRPKQARYASLASAAD